MSSITLHEEVSKGQSSTPRPAPAIARSQGRCRGFGVYMILQDPQDRATVLKGKGTRVLTEYDSLPPTPPCQGFDSSKQIHLAYLEQCISSPKPCL